MNTVWKIAPGEQACVWNECHDDKCITINWLNHKDLFSFEDKQEIKKALINGKGKGGGAYSIWQFCRGVQQGHVVVANSGLSRVVGIGLVRSGYLSPGDSRKALRCAEGRRPLQEALKRRYRLFQDRKKWPA